MRTRTRTMLLATVVASAVAVGAATASAVLSPPEAGQCLAGTGYTTNACTNAGLGGWGWNPLLPGPAGTVEGGKLTLTSQAGVRIVCTHQTGTSEALGPKNWDEMTSTGTGCTGFKGQVCTTSGDVPGEISSQHIKAEMGFINTAGETVGLDFSPETGTILYEFTCTHPPGTLDHSVTVRGAVIGKIGPDNNMRNKWTEAFVTAVGSPSTQVPEKLEAPAPKQTLEIEVNASPLEPAGLRSTLTLSNPGGVLAEINTE
jgi:hypothetical protein